MVDRFCCMCNYPQSDHDEDCPMGYPKKKNESGECDICHQAVLFDEKGHIEKGLDKEIADYVKDIDRHLDTEGVIRKLDYKYYCGLRDLLDKRT